MKETPEQVFKRVYYNKKEIPDTASKFNFDMAELYHQERLKSSLPSEQEITNESEVRYPVVTHSNPNDTPYKEMNHAFRYGAEYILELLTKGDR